MAARRVQHTCIITTSTVDDDVSSHLNISPERNGTINSPSPAGPAPGELNTDSPLSPYGMVDPDYLGVACGYANRFFNLSPNSLHLLHCANRISQRYSEDQDSAMPRLAIRSGSENG